MSPSTLPLTSFSSSPSPTASVVVGIVSTKQLAWQVPVVALVIVAIIVGITLIIWNGKRATSIRRRLIGPEPSLFLSPASQNHMETATAQRGIDTPEPPPVLPSARSRPPRPHKPQLGVSGPSMPRDVITCPLKVYHH